MGSEGPVSVLLGEGSTAACEQPASHHGLAPACVPAGGVWVVLPREIFSKFLATELKRSFLLPPHLYSSCPGVFYEQIDMI